MIQFMRGASSAVTSDNPTLQAGQPFYEIDTHKLKIGDGSTAWNDLPYIGGSGSTSPGKKYATVVVGTSTAGYTEDQVDYLCDGVDDDITIEEALSYLDSIGGGVLQLTHGTFTVSNSISVSDMKNITISGCGDSTVITNVPNMNSHYMFNGLRFNHSSLQNMCIKPVGSNFWIVVDIHSDYGTYENLYLDYSEASTTSEGTALRIYGDCRICNNIRINGNNQTIEFLVQGDNCTISNVVGSDISAAGNYSAFIDARGSGLTVSNCAITNLSAAFVKVSDDATNCCISNNFASGLMYYGAITSTGNSIIANNIFEFSSSSSSTVGIGDFGQRSINVLAVGNMIKGATTPLSTFVTSYGNMTK